MTTGESVVKYLNWGSPVVAAWGANQVWQQNSFLGTILIVYVVIWVFANGAALLVLMQRNVGEFKRGLKSDSTNEENPAESESLQSPIERPRS